MNSKPIDKEICRVKAIAGNFSRHPMQMNQLLEADAEILDFRGQSADYLVFKSDGIHEEISQKLYEDPCLIGWMAVTVTISDLAAVGADPVGILLSLQVPADYTASWMQLFQKGVNEACTAYHVSILGGDTNFNTVVSVNSMGIGTIARTKPLLRTPVIPGSLIYSTAKLGLGNAYAYGCYIDSSVQVDYKPLARLKESKIIREFATACIDTSDGLIPALSVWASLNNTGIRFALPVQDFLCAKTATVYKSSSVPAWMFLAGPHGEYELVFAIPIESRMSFEEACAVAGWQPVMLGECIADTHIEFTTEQTRIICEPSEIANLFTEAGGHVTLYFQKLLNKHQQWMQNQTPFYASKK
jgi:thiamine-monophosphate kinase